MPEFIDRNTPPESHQVGGDHYLRLAVQPWKAMEAWMTPDEFAGFLRGNIIKYIARDKHAAADRLGLEDLLKASHYLDKLILHTKSRSGQEQSS